ncbi:helix-turn-helix domain-containing protein [Bacillus sp. FJAT-29790]|uniref:CdaR family transcriptional regulator n=1 Tax=Bacillus sp. FJAT-29790 TaxID=1895002 RepID=UPI001C2297E6|nr:sugar diacid recognition domain-containing protein [Bacillus sp. FJAT-29790]MBU8878404.1 helix-turn-helix domain-containing protein [Bacillus sp. FJAT-29790]
MIFLVDLAQTIVVNTTKIIEYPIIITDEKGYIIGSSDTNRLGDYHQPSIEVLEKKKTMCYEFEDVKNLKNVLPGVATPIIINNESIGVLGISGDPAEVKKYAQLVKSHVELMCHEYLKKEVSILESKTLENLIHYLINSINEEDSEYIVRYGKMLGFNLELDIRRVCLLIEIDMFSDSFSRQHNQIQNKLSWQFLQNNLMDTLKYYLIDNKEDMISLLTIDQFIVIKTIKSDESYDLFIKRLDHNIQRMMHYLKTKFNLSAIISIGSASEGIRGIKKSYQDSLKALAAGKKTEISPKIYHYNNWNITLELLSNSLTSYISNRLTENLKNFRNHDNYDTLSHSFITYCKCNMNLSETARILFLHRNSLVYRLDKIGEITSLDISSFEHCLLLYIAIKNSETENKGKKIYDDFHVQSGNIFM